MSEYSSHLKDPTVPQSKPQNNPIEGSHSTTQDTTSVNSDPSIGSGPAGHRVTAGNDEHNLTQEEQKKRGQLPRHNEPIGGA